MALTKAQRRILERTTAVYGATLKDESNTAIPLSALTTLTLTHYDVASGAVLNSRTAQDVKNANNVTVSAGGVLAWTMQPADNAIVSTTLEAGEYEEHISLFTWTYSSGTKTGRYQVVTEVEQLEKVT